MTKKKSPKKTNRPARMAHTDVPARELTASSPGGDPVRLEDLTPDPQNRRLHPARNLELIAASLKDVGAARSIVIDEDDVILAGNGVTQAALAAGLTKLRVVEASGDEVIAVRRTGLTVEQKRALALFDNRAAELAAWDIPALQADLAAGVDLAPFFTEAEFDALVAGQQGVKAEVAYEPFAGSGPQVIAAEELGRRCFAMDVEPACCQTILDRWEAFTGLKAVKVGEAVRA